MTQDQIDQRNADEQRARDAQLERQRLEAERRAAEALRRAAETRELEERASRARREREIEEQRLESVRGFTRDTDLCRRYVVERCDAALASASLSPSDRVQLTAWRETGRQFTKDYSACRDGAASACTAALASPAASESHRATLQQWRAQASPIHRALDFARGLGASAVTATQALAASIRDLPTSTHIAGGIAAGLALALIGLFAVRRRPPPAPTAGTGGVTLAEAADHASDETPATFRDERISSPDVAPAMLFQVSAPVLEAGVPARQSVAHEAPEEPPVTQAPLPAVLPPTEAVPAIASARQAPPLRSDGAPLAMSSIFGNAPTFVILYLLIMLPTYYLPYLGSNSAVLNTAGAASGAGVYPLFWLHLLCLAALVLIGLSRALLIEKAWLVIFPILALVFDLTPGLNFIPLVPTIMHLLMIILGLALASRPTVTQNLAGSR